MSKIAAGVKMNSNYFEIYEEFHCVASNGSNRRVDIFAVDRSKKRGYISVRFDMYFEQPLDVDMEKKQIY